MSPGIDQPIRLEPIFRERVWGRHSLTPFFPGYSGNSRIGEIWFTFEGNPTSLGMTLGALLRSRPELLGTAADSRYPGVCPLLLKLLFTSERLSVQVHPDDEYAQRHHQSLGKTEAWYVLDSQAPGEVAVGFRETLDRERLKPAAQSGEIENLLYWCKVSAGETIFVPAGTVHAIGAGLTIYEVQENSDVTYRLYDYGRPRELHLEHGTRVSDLSPRDFCGRDPVPLADWREHLLECEYFRMERLRPNAAVRIDRGLPYYLLLTCTRGSGTISEQPFALGQTWFVPAESAEIQIEGAGSEWLLSYTAEEPAPGVYGK